MLICRIFQVFSYITFCSIKVKDLKSPGKQKLSCEFATKRKKEHLHAPSHKIAQQSSRPADCDDEESDTERQAAAKRRKTCATTSKPIASPTCPTKETVEAELSNVQPNEEMSLNSHTETVCTVLFHIFSICNLVDNFWSFVGKYLGSC